MRVTADIIIELEDEPGGRSSFVLVRRRFEPLGWALPGGFLDDGETLEDCAIREAREETGLAVTLIEQLGTYSALDRDPRGRTITTVFIARASGRPIGADDAAEARGFELDRLPEPIVFDHRNIIDDYRQRRFGSS